MQPRLCSKTTDKLNVVLDAITKLHGLESVLITWDRIEDPQEGTVVVPVVSIQFQKREKAI